MMLRILFFIVALTTFVACRSNHRATEEIECDSHEVLSNRTCDGTCEDPAPDCLFQDPEENSRSALRCGCPIGEVRRFSVCTPMFLCRHTPTVITQCHLEDKFDTFSRITCDESGLFTSKQAGPFVDRCVHPRSGQTIPSKMVDHGSFLNCSDLTVCQKDWLSDWDMYFDMPEVRSEAKFQIASCAEDGHYVRKKWYRSGCKCLVRETGNVIPGLANVPLHVPCYPEKYTLCQLAFIAADIARLQPNSSHVVYPLCSNIDGLYPQKMCNLYGICYCQDRFTGERLPGSGVAMNCDELTTCQILQSMEGSGFSGRACDSDGRFSTKQCQTGGSCICVDADTGKRVEGTDQVQMDQVETLTCPEVTCPANMVYSTCTGCEATCENRYFRTSPCTDMCQSRCTCPDHLVWSGRIGWCVPSDVCPSRRFQPTIHLRLQDTKEYRRYNF